jgi:hypothetical protein
VATPTAFWGTPSLVRSLSRAGWGDLAGREFQGLRTTLHALTASLDDRSGQGMVTVAQVAQRAGLSLRWTRRCLHVLEDLGVIAEWRRGYVAGGRVVASWIRLSKQVLVDLVDAARPLREAADAARRRITAARVAGLAYVRRNRRSAHGELSAHLPTPSGEVSTDLAPKAPPGDADWRAALGSAPMPEHLRPVLTPKKRP